MKRTCLHQIKWEAVGRDRTTDPVEAFLETGLLRHRPPWLVPVAWFLAGNSIHFSLLDQEDRSLRQLVEAEKTDAERGYRILSDILETILQAMDFYYLPQRALLLPDLILVGESGVRITCLPLKEEILLQEEGENLISWLASHFSWDEGVCRRLSSLFDQEDYPGLQREVRSLLGREEDPGRPKKGKRQKERLDQMIEDKNLLDRLGRSIKKVRSLFLAEDEASVIHEVTGDLTPSQASIRMACLSRGLPGTPEEESGEKAYILAEDFLIGRDVLEADLCLDAHAVSRRHALIRLKGEGYTLEDLGSKNGSFLDGVPLNRHKEYRLPENCRLSFAGEDFYFRSV